MKFKVLKEARDQFRTQDTWWRQNRDATTLFVEEFLAALDQLTAAPEAGAIYIRRRERTIRRWPMPKTNCHIYYRYDRESECVIIYSVWSARRGHGPKV
ncbi:MAG: hypothetical protein B6A08_00210 [Sorangiineae bacterium NIC37A_2]|nr:MAG: hypothetical protein B6A08_00210 [Sorangiineae bacterium NIC37A_2]